MAMQQSDPTQALGGAGSAPGPAGANATDSALGGLQGESAAASASGNFPSGFNPGGGMANQPGYWGDYFGVSYGAPIGPGAAVSGTPYGNPPSPIPGMPGFSQIDQYYQSLVPVEQQQANMAMRQDLSQAGLGGTRYGSAAANSVADIGARYANQTNATIDQMRQGQINSDLDRAMQQYQADQQRKAQLDSASINAGAAGQSAYYNYLLGQGQLAQKAQEDALNYSLGAGQLGLQYYNADQAANQFAMQYPMQQALDANQLFAGQMDPALQFGQYEQNRQDQYSNMAYQDWQNNKYGMLPMLGNWAAGVGAGSPGQMMQIQTSPGQPSDASQWATGINALGSLFGGLGGLFG